MKKIVVLDGYAANPHDISWEGMEALAPLTLYDRSSEEQVIERIGDAAYVLTNKAVISQEVMDACPQLEYVGVLATGYNVVDTVYAKSKGIVVTNVPTYSTQAVAQLVFALLLEICHHVGHHSDAVHSGRWTKSEDFVFWDYPLMELAGKTMGVVGFGNIGLKTAEIAHAFGMKVLISNRSIKPIDPELGRFVSMDELLSRADVISLHMPLLPETEHLINAACIAKMKTGAILINTSRGPLVDQTDVRAALDEGKLGYYATDVVDVEPIPADNPLLGAPNCIVTPHIGWAPLEARLRLMEIATDNLRQFMAGKPVNVVNP